jgi:hypothetical protein
LDLDKIKNKRKIDKNRQKRKRFESGKRLKLAIFVKYIYSLNKLSVSNKKKDKGEKN